MVETWGLPVALDLFFAGLGAGSFCLAVLASRKKGQGFEVCSRSAAFLAPLSVAFGLAMLILDLMYKTRFWFTLRVFNADSPMSFGVWLLSLFGAISIVHALFWLPEPQKARLPMIGGWSVWRKKSYRSALGVAGMPVALAVSVYTGVLLSASALPLWRNVALPGLFCFSAMTTGFAAGGVIALRAAPAEAMEQPMLWLRSGYRILLPVHLLFTLLFLLFSFFSPSRGDLLHLVTGGNGVVWWAGVLGLGMLVPDGSCLEKRSYKSNAIFSRPLCATGGRLSLAAGPDIRGPSACKQRGICTTAEDVVKEDGCHDKEESSFRFGAGRSFSRAFDQRLGGGGET